MSDLVSPLLKEAEEAVRRALAQLHHALDVEVCRMLHDVEAQHEQLREMRLEAERSGGLSEDLAVKFRALETDLEAFRVKLEAS